MRLGRGLDTIFLLLHFLHNEFAELLANLVVELLVSRAGKRLQLIREVGFEVYGEEVVDACGIGRRFAVKEVPETVVLEALLDLVPLLRELDL